MTRESGRLLKTELEKEKIPSSAVILPRLAAFLSNWASEHLSLSLRRWEGIHNETSELDIATSPPNGEEVKYHPVMNLHFQLDIYIYIYIYIFIYIYIYIYIYLYMYIYIYIYTTKIICI